MFSFLFVKKKINDTPMEGLMFEIHTYDEWVEPY